LWVTKRKEGGEPEPAAPRPFQSCGQHRLPLRRCLTSSTASSRDVIVPLFDQVEAIGLRSQAAAGQVRHPRRAPLRRPCRCRSPISNQRRKSNAKSISKRASTACDPLMHGSKDDSPANSIARSPRSHGPRTPTRLPSSVREICLFAEFIAFLRLRSLQLRFHPVVG
jgi:hypothetical protein